MAACLPVAAAMHTWGAVATVGAEAAAYYLAALLGILYYSFAIPLPSSFFRKPASRGIGATPHYQAAQGAWRSVTNSGTHAARIALLPMPERLASFRRYAIASMVSLSSRA